MDNKQTNPLFFLGRISVTPKVLRYLAEAGADRHDLLHRHQHGEWGDITEAEREANLERIAANSVISSDHLLEKTGKHIRVTTFLHFPLTRMMSVEDWFTETDFLDLDWDT